MKVTIEYFVLFTNAGTEVGSDNYKMALLEFNIFLTLIYSSYGMENLRGVLKTLTFTSFVYGFGASHMWLHQIVDNKPLKERLLIVEF